MLLYLGVWSTISYDDFSLSVDRMSIVLTLRAFLKNMFPFSHTNRLKNERISFQCLLWNRIESISRCLSTLCPS